MRFTDVTLALSLTVLLQPIVAYPGMAKQIEDIRKRQDVDGIDGGDGDTTPVLIGDLKTIGPVTPVGQTIYNILMKTDVGTSSTSGYKPPGIITSAACKKDTCCPWWYVSKRLTLEFTGLTGRCNDLARAAIRLGFHDAGAWSQPNADAGKDFGGADGSIALDGGNEMSRSENNGLQQIVAKVQGWQKEFNVGMADLIQFAAIHATVTCPLGPRVRFFAGRKDSTKPAANGLLPDVHASADTLIQLFQDKTIPPHDLVALVGAHSTSKQFFVDPSHVGPQDTTPGIWDVRFYNQTVQTSGPKGVFKFDSDVKIAADPRASVEWHRFMDPTTGQSHWTEDYGLSYVRLSLLGVNNINNLTECSQVLPASKTAFLLPGLPFLDQ